MQPVREEGREVNASDIEHVTTLAVGGVLLLKGLFKGGPLGLLYKVGGAALLYKGQKGYRPLYDALGVALPEEHTELGRQSERIEHSVIVRRTPETLYRIWRNLENIPIFMEHIVSVHEVDDIRSLWVAKAPAGMVVKWDAEIINDVENELIAWQTLKGSGVFNAGSVHFEPVSDETTRVRVVLRYEAPGKGIGTWIAKMTGNDPQRQIVTDLAHFKAIMEVGDAVPNELPAPAGTDR